MSFLIAIRPFFLFCLFLAVAAPAHAEDVLIAAEPESTVEEQGFEPMLGENTKQLWRGYATEGWPKNWELEKGVLARVAGGEDIMTVEEFADFELRLEWKISPGGNSGVLYRVSTGDDEPYFSGMEYQIYDDSKHNDGKNTLASTGSLYAMYARSSEAAAPVGEWNRARIIVQGNHVEHWLNEKKVVECEIGSDDWNKRLAESKFAEWPKFAKNRQGHISFQESCVVSQRPHQAALGSRIVGANLQLVNNCAWSLPRPVVKIEPYWRTLPRSAKADYGKRISV